MTTGVNLKTVMLNKRSHAKQEDTVLLCSYKTLENANYPIMKEQVGGGVGTEVKRVKRGCTKGTGENFWGDGFTLLIVVRVSGAYTYVKAC